MKKSGVSIVTIALVYYGANIVFNLFLSFGFSELYPLLRTEYDHEMIRLVYENIGPTGMIIAFTTPLIIMTWYIWPILSVCVGKVCKEPEPKTQKRVLYLPLFASLLALLGWILIIVVFITAMIMYQVPAEGGYVTRFALDMFLIGFADYIILYFIFDFFNKYTLIPFFFPNNRISYGNNRWSVLRNFRMYYFAVSLFPLFLFYSISLSKLTEYIELITVIGIMIILLSSLITVLIARSYQNPLSEMVKATQQIRNEKYDIRIRVRSNDELGRLSESINLMSQELKEKQFIKETFGKIVDPSVRDHLLAGNIELGGEKKIATVLFSDIRDFTSISEKSEPTEVVKFLNEYFNSMSKVVEEANGIINKYIGDGIFALFGVPVENEVHSSDAVRSAVEMIKKVSEINQKKDKTIAGVLQIGVGIHT
jgi:adenylate cyclase